MDGEDEVLRVEGGSGSVSGCRCYAFVWRWEGFL